MNLLWAGKREKHRCLPKLKQLVDGPSEKLDELLGYLEENWDGIYGSRNLKGKVGAKEILEVGSRGVEKNIDLALCHRFKGRGDELEPGWRPERLEAEAAVLWPERLEGVLAAKNELK